MIPSPLFSTLVQTLLSYLMVKPRKPRKKTPRERRVELAKRHGLDLCNARHRAKVICLMQQETKLFGYPSTDVLEGE